MGTYDYRGSELIDYDRIVKAVAHRGYSTEAPENTLPAYVLAKQKGFFYVETDVSYTSDRVPMCLHDSTINRTSNGTGSLDSLTFAQVRQYDFGAWKSPKYAGTKIPTFTEFMLLCRNISLHPYIELKESGNYTDADVAGLINIVKDVGMEGKVTWIGGAPNLTLVKNNDPYARLGLGGGGGATAEWVENALSLRTGNNEVFGDLGSMTQTTIDLCKNAGIPLEVWIIDNEKTIIEADPYITGFTSNCLIAGKVLYEHYMKNLPIVN